MQAIGRKCPSTCGNVNTTEKNCTTRKKIMKTIFRNGNYRSVGVVVVHRRNIPEQMCDIALAPHSRAGIPSGVPPVREWGAYA